MTSMTPEQRRTLRRSQVEQCLASTISIKDWCTLNKVSQSTLYAWMARFRKEEPGLFEKPNASQWIELSRDAIAKQSALATISASAAEPLAAPLDDTAEATGTSAPILVRVNGVEIAIPPGSTDAHIASVLRAVATL